MVPREEAPRECNGNTAYCSRLYSNITFIGAHDSGNDDGTPGVDNQDMNINAQLDAGIRFVEIQVHDLLGQLRICHTSCFLDLEASLVDYLGSIKTWLDGHPNEVVTVLLALDLSADDSKHISVDQLEDPIMNSGLKHYAYNPPSSITKSTWPTLGTLIDDGNRVVIFLSIFS